MQLQDIVTEIRKTLGEVEPSGYNSQQPGDGSWDNSQIIGYINEGIGLLSHIVRLEASQQITLSTDTNTYALPTDCLDDGVRKVVYNSTNAMGPVPCTPLNLDDFEQILETPPYGLGGTLWRYRYTIWAGNIMFAPYPQYATDTATVFYYKTMPLLVNATDVPILPTRFHVALVYYALSRCQEAVEETQLQQLAFQNYQQLAAQIRAELSRHSRDSNRVRHR